MKSETRTRPIHESRSYRRVSVFRTESISMAIPLKANNTRRLRLRRRRPQELSPWSGSILETSTTWRATYRPKVSSICCRCAMPPHPPPPPPPSVLPQTWKASAAGNFANASRRVPAAPAAYAVTLLATRRRPNLSPFRPKGSLSSHYSTPRLASLSLSPPPPPPRNGRARSLLEPCLIAYSRHLPKSLLQGDACRVINIYSLGAGRERRAVMKFRVDPFRFPKCSCFKARKGNSVRFGNIDFRWKYFSIDGGANWMKFTSYR